MLAVISSYARIFIPPRDTRPDLFCGDDRCTEQGWIRLDLDKGGGGGSRRALVDLSPSVSSV